MFRDEFLRIKPTIEPIETVAGPAFIRTITAGEKDEFEREAKKDGKVRCRLLLVGVCDEQGKPVFTNLDLPTLDALPLTAVEPIADAIAKLNKFGEAEVEDIRKNSPSPADGSSTG